MAYKKYIYDMYIFVNLTLFTFHNATLLSDYIFVIFQHNEIFFLKYWFCDFDFLFFQLDRYTYIIDLYLSYGFNVMIIGDKGSGKSSLVENLLQTRLPITRLPITPALTASQLQDKILTRVNAAEKRAGQRLSHRGSSNKFIFFLDDVHLAQKRGNVSTVLELTRFVSTHRQLYDYSRNYLHTLSEARFISSCTSEGYWKLSNKFSRVFNPVPFLPPSDDCLKQIFSSSVLQWLQAFPDNSVGNTEALAEVRLFIQYSIPMLFNIVPEGL